jgi:hypothetical protein
VIDDETSEIEGVPLDENFVSLFSSVKRISGEKIFSNLNGFS